MNQTDLKRHEFNMQKCIGLAINAKQRGDNPVGSVIIRIESIIGEGIGKLIMDNIEKFLNREANNNSFVGLMAAEGTKDFYNMFGYIERPENRPGMFKMIKK